MNRNTHVGRTAARALLASLAAACGLALTTAGWAADDAGNALTKVVSYADLNLDSEAGAGVLHRRLRYAAARVCEPLEGRRFEEVRAWRTCVDSAMTQAIAQIDSPRLTAYHLVRTGKTAAPVAIARGEDVR